MVKIVREIFHEDEVAIFEGDVRYPARCWRCRSTTSSSPARLHRQVVMAAAAKHLTSVTSNWRQVADIIDDSANLKKRRAT